MNFKSFLKHFSIRTVKLPIFQKNLKNQFDISVKRCKNEVSTSQKQPKRGGVVFKKGSINPVTQKYPKFLVESGRSMVEMLGVLAVIGVLTIAGIMGYQYAMIKYQANQIVHELNMLDLEAYGLLMKPHENDMELSFGDPYDNGYLIQNNLEFDFGCASKRDNDSVCPNGECVGIDTDSLCFSDDTQFFMEIKVPSQKLCRQIAQLTAYLPYFDMQFINNQEDISGAFCSEDKENNMLFLFSMETDEADNEEDEGIACDNDTDCAEGEICHENICRMICRKNKFYDANSNCYSCSIPTAVDVSGVEENCESNCPGKRVLNGNTCILASCDTDMFQDYFGNCHSCSENDGVYVRGVTENCESNCPGKRVLNGNTCILASCGTDMFQDYYGNCVSCSENKSIYVSGVTENCDACNGKRKIVNTDYCALSSCGTDMFQDSDGICYACSEVNPADVIGVEENCNDCNGKRKIVNSRYCALSSCGPDMFQDRYGSCYACSENYAINVTGVEENCEANCPGQRKLFGHYCSPSSCGTDMFQDYSGNCLSCSITRAVDVTGVEDNCEANCPGQRMLSPRTNKCIRTSCDADMFLNGSENCSSCSLTSISTYSSFDEAKKCADSCSNRVSYREKCYSCNSSSIKLTGGTSAELVAGSTACASKCTDAGIPHDSYGEWCLSCLDYVTWNTSANASQSCGRCAKKGVECFAYSENGTHLYFPCSSDLILPYSGMPGFAQKCATSCADRFKYNSYCYFCSSSTVYTYATEAEAQACADSCTGENKRVAVGKECRPAS